MPERTIDVQRDLLQSKKEAADRFRACRRSQGTLVVQLLSSPGAGKTSLIEAMARQLRGTLRVGVLVGDIATDRDAQRLAQAAPAVQLTTGGACHLELPLVEKGLAKLGDDPFELLILEDVGNLVCPASHDLGQHLRVVLLSTPEGDDKPAKYPKAFRTSDALVLTKVDLLPHVPFSLESAIADARSVQPKLDVFPLSVKTGAGLDEWCEYLVSHRQRLLNSKPGVEAAGGQ